MTKKLEQLSHKNNNHNDEQEEKTPDISDKKPLEQAAKTRPENKQDSKVTRKKSTTSKKQTKEKTTPSDTSVKSKTDTPRKSRARRSGKSQKDEN